MRLLRSGLFSLWFLGVSIIMVLTGIFLKPTRLPAWGIQWSRLILSGMWIAGMRVEITGQENLPRSGPMLIASMHQSAFDTLIWLQLLPYARYIVKAELMRIPLFGILAARSGQIGVNRSGGAATMRGLLRDGGAALDEGSQVVIFPEGTRVPAGETVELQPGIAALAMRSRQGVLPVLTDSGLCWGRGAFSKRPGVIRVVILPALPVGLPRPQLMARLTELYAKEASAQRARVAVDNFVH